MEEIGTCIATKLAECLWDPISRGASYLFRFKQFIGDLGKAKDELEVKLADVNKRREEADRKTEEIMPSVKRWLDDVNSILKEVQKLQQEVKVRGKKCFNVSLKYSLAKQMEDKANQMMKLKIDSNFEPFSQLIQLPGIGSQFSSKEIMDFKSRKSTQNSLLEAIKDGKNKMVGLYGMGGSGKTTLAIEVGKKVEQLKLFDKVIMVVVSRPLNVRNIQEEVKGKTGLTFTEMTESTTAQRLLIGLKSMKILIILDDVWSNLEPQEIGIPLHENCRILLTTRNRNVCDSMRCDIKFALPLLETEEARTLLKIHANITNDSLDDFAGVGEKIVDECKGLPIAIVTVGSALRGKGFAEWKSALERLQHSLPLDIDEGSRGPYACLKLSYDYLPSPLAQSLFLLCSMFPEDHKIHIEDLIRFSKGALKFEEISYSIDGARSEIIASTNRLLDSCLLIHTDKDAYVKMHDLVRDVAMWIAKKQHRAILVDSQAVSRMVEHERLEKTEVISLWNLEDDFKFSNQLHCPTLELLLLHPKGFIEDIGGIEALRVLALVTFSFQWRSHWRNRIQWSPQSTVSRNLHTICFRGIELGDISFLCQLKRLEILDLRRSKFNELPARLVHMNELKLLDVFGCEIEKSPLGVIEKCEQLEELYVWDKKSAIQENFSLSGLKRYVIYDSTCSFDEYEEAPFRQYFDDEGIKELRALCIQGFKVSALNSSMKDLIFRANYLWLENCLWDYKDISFEIKHLVVSHCPQRTGVDASFLQTGQVLPHLITLRLIKMDSLEQVFSHATLPCHCPALKELKIQDCPKLDRLVDEEATQGDPLLDDAKDNPHGNETASAFVVVKADSFGHLRNQKLLTLLLSLDVIIIQRSGRRMKGMFEVQVMGGTLLESEEYSGEQEEPLKLFNSELCILLLEGLPVLEYIWKGPTQSVSLRRLVDVQLSGCPKLRNIFTPTVVTSLPELKSLHVFDCEELEGVFCEESLKNLSSSNVCFPKLQQIWIRGCNKVKRLFPYSLASHCPSLDIMYIGECFELERLLDEAAANRDRLPLLKLMWLELSYLPKLRDIFGEGLECPKQPSQNNQKERGRVVNSELREISLYELPVLECIWKGPTQSVSLHRLEYVTLFRCPKLRSIFTPTVVTSLPKLEKLHVSGCEEWEGVFCEESHKNLSPSNVCFPKLQGIEISGCNKVKRVFPYSLASHCPSLVNLDLMECFERERLFDEAAADRDGLSLPKLKTLILCKLPKLRDIFGEGLECPQQENKNERGRVVNSELCTISLVELPVLECIWKGPTQSISLHGLESVVLQRCPKVKNIFTLTIVPSLPMLTTLSVFECKEWEGIFCEESLVNLSSSSSSSFNVCFPKLKTIYIGGCNKVKWLFSYPLVSHCPSLERITIEDCCDIEWVVEGCEGEVGDQEKLFPSLKDLSLKNLPKLRDVYKGYEFNLLSGTTHIQDCPSIQNIPPLEYKASSDSDIRSENEVDEDDFIPLV